MSDNTESIHRFLGIPLTQVPFVDIYDRITLVFEIPFVSLPRMHIATVLVSYMPHQNKIAILFSSLHNDDAIGPSSGHQIKK